MTIVPLERADAVAATATSCLALPVVLVAWIGSGLSADEHLRRILRVRTYVLARRDGRWEVESATINQVGNPGEGPPPSR